MSDIEVGKLNKLKTVKKDFPQAEKLFGNIEKGLKPDATVIAQRARIPADKIHEAINFWKNVYTSVTTEGRLLNGAEAYELGDEKTRSNPNKDVYIAMCNLMTLEAIIRMGDEWPTVEEPEEMVFGSEREKDIANFWKINFAPTLFQTKWAWSSAMAVLAGEPHATEDIIYRYKDQL